MTDRLRLVLLGAPEVWVADQVVTGFRSSKAQALLFYLAVEAAKGAPTQTRATLAGLLWGGVDEVYARRSLNQTLSNLRQVVGAYITTTPQLAAFDRDQARWLDVEILETAAQLPVNAANVPAITQAVALYRGDFLAGFFLRDAPEFEQWILGEQARLRIMVLELLSRLAAYHDAQQDWAEAIAVTRRILQLEPWREEAHRQLIQLLAQTGQRSAALAQYELCRRVLADELQVEPDEATLTLVEQIRSGNFDKGTRWQGGKVTSVLVASTGSTTEAPNPPFPPSPLPLVSLSPPPPNIPHNLPAHPTPFVGREKDVAEICNLLLTEPTCRLLTLVGPGGMGKTRLSLKAAETLVTALPATATPPIPFSHGIFFVPLEAVHDRGGIVSAIISAIAGESGFPLQTTLPLEEQLLDYLRTKTLLLVLDNFEHLISAATLLTDLLATAQGVKVLVTTREILGLQEEWFFPVTGLTMPSSDGQENSGVLASDAVQLFAQSARRAQRDFSLDAELAQVVRICRLVDGMPLALELAAAWLKGMTCQQIVGELTRSLDILTARHQNIPPRHRSMRAVLSQSWEQLSAAEQGAAARLSIFRGSFGEAAATAVSGASLLTLALLVEKSLLRLTPERRYWMHELTRQYAAEQLAGAHEVYASYAHYYGTLLQALYPQLFGPQASQTLLELGVEIDNIQVAWQWLMQQLDQPGQDAEMALTLLAQLAPALTEYYYTKGLFQEGQRTFLQVVQRLQAPVALPQNSRHTLLAQLQVRASMMAYELGQFSSALEQIRSVMPLLSDWGNQAELALAYLMLGKANYRRGERATARGHLETSLAHAQAAGALEPQATAYNNLSHIAQDEGKHDECERLLRACLALYEELGYALGIGTTQGNLGFCYMLQGKYEAALPHFQTSLAIAEAHGDPVSSMVAIGNIAETQQRRGRPRKAIADYERSLHLARELGVQRWIVRNLNGLSRSYSALDDLATAWHYLFTALPITRTAESMTDLMETLTLWAELWAKQGNADQALPLLYFVAQQPATAFWNKQQYQALLDQLTTTTTPAQVNQAQEWASGQTLDEVLEWLAPGATAPAATG